MPLGTTCSLSAGDVELVGGLLGDGGGVGDDGVGQAAGQAQRASLRGAEPVREIAAPSDRARAGEAGGGDADEVGVEVVRVDDADFSRRQSSAMRAICSAVLGCASEPRSGKIDRLDAELAQPRSSSPPRLEAGEERPKARRSRRRNSSNSWRSVPPTLRQSTTCRTAIALSHGARSSCDGRRRRGCGAVEEGRAHSSSVIRLQSDSA